MLYYIRTRAEDVRALVGAIVLGSSAGLVLGGVYLVGSRAASVSAGPEAPLRPVAARGSTGASFSTSHPAPRRLSSPATLSAAPAIQVAALAESLRDRIRLTRLGPTPAAPFQARQDAGTDADLHCLAEAVYFEARGEPEPGQQAVAQVVLNRVRHPAFPKTICAVVHQRTASGCQFSFACSPREAATGGLAWRRAQSVALQEMHGAVMTAVGDATHFQTARAGAFAGLLKVAQIGAHVFYRFAGHAGAGAPVYKAPAPPRDAPVELARLETPKAPVIAAPSPLGPGLVPAAAVLKPASVSTDPKPSVAAVAEARPASDGRAPVGPGSSPPAMKAAPPAVAPQAAVAAPVQS